MNKEEVLKKAGRYWSIVHMTHEDYALELLSGNVVPRHLVGDRGWVDRWPGMIALYEDGAKYIWSGGSWKYLYVDDARLGACPGPETQRAPERMTDHPSQEDAWTSRSGTRSRMSTSKTPRSPRTRTSTLPRRAARATSNG